MSFREVYPAAYNQNYSPTHVYCLRCKPEHGSHAIRLCVKNDPLVDFPHVKRVRKVGEFLEVITGCSDIVTDEIRDFMETTQQNELFRTEIPSKAPFTKEQAAEWSKVWPITYRKPNWDPIVLSSEEEQLYTQMIRTAINSGKKGSVSGESSGCGCVIIDSKNRIVADTYDRRLKHPLEHGVMRAIDEFSKLILEEQGNCAGLGRIGHCPLEENADDSAKRQKTIENSIEETHRPRTMDDQYLCQGTKVFVSHEPCVMCSMALVHSRVDLVVYANPWSVWGGLGSFEQLHSTTQLNHKFRVLIFTENESN
eukprot:GDKJ01015152.1.p1 GENE.GDKJ01015152.1~~GDKJ01015152.1.p1  ORF type:complete len:310 (+),score=13.52 GDKJ01015152.1:232-1161(+)